MVLAKRSNKPIVTSAPLKVSKKQGEHLKKVRKFSEAHVLKVGRDSQGNPKMIVSERNDK